MRLRVPGPARRRSWLGQGCADQFWSACRAGVLLSRHASSEYPFARVPETTARESNQQLEQETWKKIAGIHAARVGIIIMMCWLRIVQCQEDSPKAFFA